MKIDVSTQAGYDLATALRGPDSNTSLSATLKVLFTARLRHFVGVQQGYGNAIRIRTGAGVLPRPLGLNLWAWTDQRRDWLDGCTHFLSHVIAACEGVARGRMAGFSPPQRGEAGCLAQIAEHLYAVAETARYDPDDIEEALRVTREAEKQYQEYLRLFAAGARRIP
jgi:hypothetical protein